MIIGVSTVLFSTAFFKQYNLAISNSIALMASKMPQHQFIVIPNFQQQFECDIETSNCKIIYGNAVVTSAFKKQIWLSFKLPHFLKKHQIDCLINLDGYIASKQNIPQFTFVLDNSFLSHSKTLQSFQYKNLKQNKGLVQHFFTNNNVVKQFLIENIGLETSSVTDFQLNISNTYQALQRQQQLDTRTTFSNDENYFLYIHNALEKYDVIQLLKAFSIFKKWQKSNIKLVLYHSNLQSDKHFLAQLQLYKYRADVVLLGNNNYSHLPQIIASTYAVVLPNYQFAFPYHALAALQCNVPVIISQTPHMEPILQNAAVYLTDNKTETLTNQMQLIFKDERLRNQLIENGKLVAEQFNNTNALQILVDAISSISQF